jgi:hypothetical protein
MVTLVELLSLMIVEHAQTETLDMHTIVILILAVFVLVEMHHSIVMMIAVVAFLQGGGLMRIQAEWWIQVHQH